MATLRAGQTQPVPLPRRLTGKELPVIAGALPYFHAVQDGFLYRVYISASDLVFVRLGKGQMPTESRALVAVDMVAIVCTIVGFLIGVISGAIIGFLVGGTFGGPRGGLFGGVCGFAIGGFAGTAAGLATASMIRSVMNPNAAPDERAIFERSVSEMDAYLCKCDLEEIRSYVSEKKCGYAITAKKVEAKIDNIGKWRRFFFGKPIPTLIIEHPSKSRMTLVFRKRADIVIGLYELEQLLGDKLEIELSMDDYEKALKKYQEMREA